MYKEKNHPEGNPETESVSLPVPEQAMWERDVALHQLRNHYHVGLGEIQNPAMTVLEDFDWDQMCEAISSDCEGYFLGGKQMSEEKNHPERNPETESVSLSVLEQVMWERDMALHQLRDHYHVGLGEIQNPAMTAIEGINWDQVSESVECLKACTPKEGKESLDAVIRVFDTLHSAYVAGGCCNYFGMVRWCDDDLVDALEERNIPATKGNVQRLRNRLEHQIFAAPMISAGWDFINTTIEILQQEGKLEG